MKNLLFICTGNICRSPTAHALALHQIKKLGLKNIVVDSAGISGVHVGEKPDSRAVAVGRKRGVDFSGIFSRQIEAEDFVKFDLIFAMDRGHISALRKICPPQFQDKIQLFLEYADVENRFNDEVIDPYYGGVEGFVEVFELIEKGTREIIIND
ncbi:MAG: low molecular weight protein-tyrosine-phosphatase [Pseudomonadota bacterium]